MRALKVVAKPKFESRAARRIIHLWLNRERGVNKQKAVQRVGQNEIEDIILEEMVVDWEAEQARKVG